MIRDVFYYGNKPNVHSREKFATSLEDARKQCTTEHNADYLTKQDIDLQKQAGVNSLNIAPQLGVIHTNVLTTLGKEFENEFNIFKKYVLEKEV